MAIELGKVRDYISHQLGKLPEGSPDRPVLAEILQRANIHMQERNYERVYSTVKEYQTRPHTPELLTRTWQTVWNIWAERVKKKVVVPPCDRTTEEIRALEENKDYGVKSPRMLIFIPEGFSGSENRDKWYQMFPDMDVTERVKWVKNKQPQSGWLDTESTVGPAYTDARTLFTLPAGRLVTRLEKELQPLGKVGQTLDAYVYGSQFKALTSDEYFDQEGTMTLLTGSYHEGDAPTTLASFDSRGRLKISMIWDMHSLEHLVPNIGIRTIKSKGASQQIHSR